MLCKVSKGIDAMEARLLFLKRDWHRAQVLSSTSKHINLRVGSIYRFDKTQVVSTPRGFHKRDWHRAQVTIPC